MKKKLISALLINLLGIFSVLCAAVFPYRENGKYGLMNQELEVIKYAEYDSMTPECKNQYFIANKKQNNKIEFYIFDSNGSCIYESKESIRHIWNDYFSVTTQKGEKLISLSSDKEITAYQFVSSQEPMIPCRKDIYRQYIDESGNVIFPELEFRRAYGFYENHSVNIDQDWQYEVIDKKGNYKFGKIFSELGQHFSEGLLYAREKTGKSGYVDYEGKFKIVIPLKKSDEDTCIAIGFYKDRSIVNTKNQGICLINKEGKIIKDNIKVSWFYDFSDDFALVTKNDGSFNFISLEGNFISSEDFEYAENFCNGYAIINLNGNDGLINKKGKVTILR